MSRYEIEFEAEALRGLARIPRHDQTRVLARIDTLAEDPRPAGSTKLKGQDAYRVRQGNYRIVYMIDDPIRVVTITKIADRKEVYR